MQRVVIILLVLFAAPAFAVDRYISSSGTNNGTCTDSGSPCATWSYVFGVFSAGDTIIVKDGSVFDSNDGGQGSITDCGGDHGTRTYSLKVPDKSCTAVNPCTIRAETNVEVMPEGWKDLIDEVPNWEILNRDTGNGHGCIGVDSADHWNISGFECNTHAGLAICNSDNVKLEDFIADVEGTWRSGYDSAEGGTTHLFDANGVQRSFIVYNSTNITLSGFRYRPWIYNHHTAGNDIIETPGWNKPQGPGTTSMGTGGSRWGRFQEVTGFTMEDFDVSNWPYGADLSDLHDFTIRRGANGTSWGHAIEIVDGSTNGLIENIVFYQPVYGHCWDGSLPESTAGERTAKQATITSTRCLDNQRCIDVHGNGAGDSNVCRLDDMVCDISLGTGTPSDLTGICGTTPADQLTCKGNGGNTGVTCTASGVGQCNNSNSQDICAIDSLRAGGPLHSGPLTIFDGDNIIIRNNSYFTRNRASQSLFGAGYNLQTPSTNTGSPSKCATQAGDVADYGTATWPSLCNNSIKSGRDPNRCDQPGSTDCNDGDGSTCWNVCVWKDIGFYNNLLTEPGDDTNTVADDTRFIDLHDSHLLKLGLGDEVHLDCNVYAGDNPADASVDFFECEFNRANCAECAYTWAEWQGASCNIRSGGDVWLADAQTPNYNNDPPGCSGATCDRPAPVDPNSSYIALMSNVGIEDYDAGDYRPSATSTLLTINPAATCNKVDTFNSQQMCASEDFYGNTRSGDCIPGAFTRGEAPPAPTSAEGGMGGGEYGNGEWR